MAIWIVWVVALVMMVLVGSLVRGGDDVAVTGGDTPQTRATPDFDTA
jgi:hypothetical protein